MITIVNNKTIKNFTLTAFVFLLVFSVSTPAEAQQGSNPYIGKRLYRSYCLVCHGQFGSTKGPLAKKLDLTPADLTSNKYQKKSVDELTKIIGGYGRAEDDLMPAWRNAITEANIKHIAAYLSRIKSANLRLVGDTRRGRMLFQSSCASCHGPKGRGNGILAKIIGAPMGDFTKPRPDKRYSDKALIAIIRKGKGKFMPGWKQTLNDDEIIDVAAYVRNFIK